MLILLSDLKLQFGRRLSKIRLRHGYTQAALGKRIGVDGNTIARIERGEQGIRWSNLEKLPEALDIEAAELWTDDVVISKPSPKEAWETVGKFIDGMLKNPQSPDQKLPTLSLIPDEVAASPALAELLRAIANDPGIIDDLLTVIAPSGPDQTKRRSRS